ncbi:adenylate/guanylate cyclase domain-containing protein [Reyranella sp.]|uniref:adenylate/guanylate cyclase domain-containing protein n=1 Tax=Reyranella sp. TaxID=1929291 RepID=UPI003BA859C8
MDVRGWLETLGLGQYGDSFVANHIDGPLLRGLGADDLRELGVGSLGHRKRLLDAIARLREGEAPAAAAPEAERRQVAVLFADLCRFTELSGALGAEEMRRIVDRFLSRADELIVEHGGSVDKHIGDATMAVFGAPVAHEDDPLRAVAAADAIRSAVPLLSAELGRPASAPLASHIGIALGEVVAGEMGGSVRRDYTVLGDTVNLAARLVGEAGPGEVVLDDATWRAVAGRVRGTTLGERPLKGIARPQRLWRLDEVRDGAAGGRLPFVGREIELAQIAAMLAASQHGAVLHLRGEAGIGKSRLLAEALAEAGRRGFVGILVRVLDFGAGRRQTPLRVLAEALVAVRPDWIEDPAVEAGLRAALHDVLERDMPPELATPYAAMQDSRRSALRADAVAALAGAASAATPLAIGVEDLHWASDTVRAFVRAAARLTVALPLVLLTTSRPEGDPLDSAFRRDLGGASVVVVELGPLAGEAMRRLAQAAASAVDETQVARFVARSGGNPLFLEQLALSAAEAEAPSLPSSIRGLVQARLDRLGRADRAALQAASVLGQRFPAPALQALTDDPAYDPRPLLDGGLLVRDGTVLMFAHALIQEATYASLLSEAARGLHRRAADWLGEGEPELRAQHLDRAADPGAARAYQAAAERLRDAGRLAAALENAQRGLALAREDTDVVALALLAGRLHLELGAARAARGHFETALARASDDVGRGEAELGIAESLRIVDDLAGATAALDRAQALADSVDLPALASRCRYLRGNLLFPMGRVDACMQEHRAALDLAERAQSPALVARALGGLADAYYARGEMRSALEALQRCIEAARRAGTASVEIANRPMAAIAECFMMRLDSVREMAELARVMARQAHNPRAELIALHALMLAGMESGRTEEALPHVDRARAIVAELGAWRFEGENLIFGAELQALAGNAALATSMAREAVMLCREHAMAYLGPAVLGLAARLVDDATEREALLEEGDRLLEAPTLGHNHFFFRRYAIEAELAQGHGEAARRHALALGAYAEREPTPFTDLVVRRGVLLADAATGRLTPEGRAELGERGHAARRAGYAVLAAAMLAPDGAAAS